MKCPVDETVLQMSERQGVEIDYCPECRGVWLDRGELDKIIAADQARSSPAAAAAASDAWSTSHDDGRGSDRGDHGRKRKKESFFGDLFDF
jgi:Zn-finger nucleic acid-binding protein